MILRSAIAPSRRVVSARWLSSTSRLSLPRQKPSPPQRRPESNASSPLHQPPQETSAPSQQPQQPPKPSIAEVLASTDASQNSLLAPVHIPEDPNAVLKSSHPATNLLAQSGLVVQRQIEMMNIFLGFEQANRYVILGSQGEHIGYMAEHDGGIGKSMGRQFFKTHRAFETNVFDRTGKEVLRFHRPFSYINTRIRVFDPLEPKQLSPTEQQTSPSTALTTSDPMNPQVSSLPLSAMRIIGECHSHWAPLRRKYNLFLAHDPPHSDSFALPHTQPSDLSPTQQQQQQQEQHSDTFAQFAAIDEPFLSWNFDLKDISGGLVGNINRSWGGFGREIFTDTGVYALRMDAAVRDAREAEAEQRDRPGYSEVLGGDKFGMTLDQRAVLLATAVTVDFDYFSRHSGQGGGGFLPLWMMGGGGEAAGAGGAAGAAGAGEAGAVVGGEGASAVIGGAGRAAGGAVGAGEGAMAGAGSLAGYEAMQRGAGRGEYAEQQQGIDDASPVDQQGGQPPQGGQDEYGGDMGQGQGQDQGDAWGSGDNDPWSQPPATGDGGGGGDGGGSWWDTLWDFFGGD